jgi:PTH2 family peptidyl-tRNA hydrolase
MTKGKIAAQCCHATLAAYKAVQRRQPAVLDAWENHGQPKITLKVNGEVELLELKRSAEQHGLSAQLIQDAGRTQIAPGSRTVLAIGPGKTARVSKA